MQQATHPIAKMKNHHSHKKCFACGKDNAASLGLHFYSNDNGGVTGETKSYPFLQGYPDILHGGIVATMLDSAMTHCLFHHDITALTADLHVRYLLPVPCQQKLNLTAWITRFKPPLYCLRSELHVGEKLMAYADAKFMRKEL